MNALINQDKRDLKSLIEHFNSEFCFLDSFEETNLLFEYSMITKRFLNILKYSKIAKSTATNNKLLIDRYFIDVTITKDING